MSYIVIGAVGLTLFILFMMFMAVIAKVLTKEDGWFDLGINAFYFNQDTGAVGSFRKRVDHENGGFTDVYYSPLNNPFHLVIDRSIPVASVTDEITSGVDKPGVQNRYVFVTSNSKGDCRLMEQVGHSLGKKTAILSKKLQGQVTATQIAESARDEAARTADEYLSKISDRNTRGRQSEGGLSDPSFGWRGGLKERYEEY